MMDGLAGLNRFRWQQGDIHGLDGDMCQALQIWCSLANGAFAPKWTIRFLTDLPSCLSPMSHVIQTGEGHTPYPYRFFGTGLAELHGFDLTGRNTDAIEPEDFRNVCIQQHQVTIRERAPCVFLNRIPMAGSSVLTLSHVALRLPFSADGLNVTEVATVEVAADSLADLKKAFAAA